MDGLKNTLGIVLNYPLSVIVILKFNFKIEFQYLRFPALSLYACLGERLIEYKKLIVNKNSKFNLPTLK